MQPFDDIKARAMRFPEVDLTKGRSIAYSRSVTRRIMELIDGNSQGNVHGGVIMRMVDEAAAIVAIKHSQRPCVTARVERFDFVAPAYIGNVVTVDCALNYVGRTSMEVGVEVTAEDLMTGEVRKIASSYVIYVALNEQGKPTPVPPLEPADEEEAARIERARIRRQHMKRLDEELEKLHP
ncbi:acyl-CoA hydrolase [Thermosporothrix hazakensis]|jgi:acyl-CoA hydrolase|uniref:Acyl-CoA hydrolase n=2 Tax=Thermosporothrix TaxID=768650 RepID=A0A326UBF9_THEHA|nr:acyl-CoA thioesterase [Thermosporothrix hazakensis]PZW22406.1 acyl-CoA hydrolase [Thermosporothrix hazakensis]BBH91108.1 acyl-CoA thioesterase [Thermosporothrix sp. COM3]GCE49160.1 acyl-CoA thioesterase [Thermosporothrix hazakensis]